MTEMKFTPGLSVRNVNDIDFSHEVCLPSGDAVAAVYEGFGQYARLIAAAPEMFEALTEVRTDLRILMGNVAGAAKHDPRWEGYSATVAGWVDRIDDALSKALGKEG